METSKAKQFLTESYNWLTIIFAATLYILMGLMTIENGNITLTNFSHYTWLDWVLWSILTFLPAFIAVIISTALKKEGIKEGKKVIQTYISDYENYLSLDKEKKVRSEKEYLVKGALVAGTKKFISALVLSMVAGQLFFNLTTDGALKIFINIAMWAFFGVQAFGNSYKYAITELKEWYILAIAKLKGEKDAN